MNMTIDDERPFTEDMKRIVAEHSQLSERPFRSHSAATFHVPVVPMSVKAPVVLSML